MSSVFVHDGPVGRTPIWLVSVVCLVPAACWMGYLSAYANKPGPSDSSLKDWPTGTLIPRDHDRPVLLMFIHPQCPCSSASLEELARVLTQARDLASVYTVFVRPTGMAPGWEASGTWRQAAAIPGVKVMVDASGVEARRFAATTSGEVTLFNKTGALLFRGGMTSSRGHAGDNIGREAVYSWLTKDVAQHRNTFVFGCPLFSGDEPDAKEWP